jgi:hypothetical protein
MPCCGVGKTNHRFIFDWLIELSKLQSYLEMYWFAQALLQPGLQVGKCHFVLELTRELNYDSLPNGWCIT